MQSLTKTEPIASSKTEPNASQNTPSGSGLWFRPVPASSSAAVYLFCSEDSVHGVTPTSQDIAVAASGLSAFRASPGAASAALPVNEKPGLL
eukprot:CAMPEP_0184359748 /NCGR_PEP_ID=MMETSP1089-20130417/121571_1 /TAXON_ID=38269 ORGANISM="Gloeochaete wittrockiana, Strain SAG46.84" /NCGR_SAMPLE_ID=MMETSP1089 /ASSEMBLY_ACC=CAM_ASM_000445 /LENGTH=91 /DNA_ID=CAMNT_0026698679 /DNA_START=121 /DNA_END=392 /DNA_ORIENTATION=+